MRIFKTSLEVFFGPLKVEAINVLCYNSAYKVKGIIRYMKENAAKAKINIKEELEKEVVQMAIEEYVKNSPLVTPVFNALGYVVKQEEGKLMLYSLNGEQLSPFKASYADGKFRYEALTHEGRLTYHSYEDEERMLRNNINLKETKEEGLDININIGSMSDLPANVLDLSVDIINPNTKEIGTHLKVDESSFKVEIRNDLDDSKGIKRSVYYNDITKKTNDSNEYFLSFESDDLKQTNFVSLARQFDYQEKKLL